MDMKDDLILEKELRVFTGTLDMIRAVFKKRSPIPSVDMVEIVADPMVLDLIIANLEFLRPIFEERARE